MLDRLQRHDWPGNVRQLQNCVRAAVYQSVGPSLLPEHLLGLPASQAGEAPCPATGQAVDLSLVIESMLCDGENRVHARVVALVERELIARALRVTHGHQAQARELLGLSQVTLRNKMRELGITLDKVVSGSGDEADG